MKHRNYILALSLTITLILGSFFVSHLTSLSANKSIQQLAGVSIVLDAGHGGRDDGARSGTIKEDEINLAITKKLKTMLVKAGARVILTRDGDYDLAQEGAKSRKKEDMKKRVELMNQEDVDLFMSIHLNAYPNTNVKGAIAFYQKDSEVSKAFAQIVQKHLKTLTNSIMSVKTGDYYVLNNTTNIGVLVECGFLSNHEDRTFLIQNEYQIKVAKTLYESVLEYFHFLS